MDGSHGRRSRRNSSEMGTPQPRGGDAMRRMNDAQRALAEAHLQLVTWVLNNRVPFWRRDEYDDMWQAGAIGLCKAAMLFDESVGVKFGTYAAVFIRGEMIDLGKRSQRQARQSGDARLEDIVLNDKDIVTLGDTIQDREDGQAMEALLILRETMNRIKGKDRLVLEMEMAGYGQEEIGRRVGVSQSGVSRILTRSRKLIADEYAR